MTVLLKKMCLILAVFAINATSFAELPEGTFTGQSNIVKSSLTAPNAMALIIKKDQATGNSYAILAEYERKPWTHFVTALPIGATIGKEASYLTSWVNRMYIYKVDGSGMSYKLIPLKVDADGNIVPMLTMPAVDLNLKTEGSLLGAQISRYYAKNKVELINMNGKYPANSTWEDMIPGNYFGSTDSSGGDYTSSDVNTSLFEDGTLNLDLPNTKGTFSLTEKLPGMFVVKSNSSFNKGNDKVAGRIVVFIDIVNWKSLGIDRFTTEEMLMINPFNASDVGFYYERH
jgi:hypothetical protein